MIERKQGHELNKQESRLPRIVRLPPDYKEPKLDILRRKLSEAIEAGNSKLAKSIKRKMVALAIAASLAYSGHNLYQRHEELRTPNFLKDLPREQVYDAINSFERLNNIFRNYVERRDFNSEVRVELLKDYYERITKQDEVMSNLLNGVSDENKRIIISSVAKIVDKISDSYNTISDNNPLIRFDELHSNFMGILNIINSSENEELKTRLLEDLAKSDVRFINMFADSHNFDSQPNDINKLMRFVEVKDLLESRFTGRHYYDRFMNNVIEQRMFYLLCSHNLPNAEIVFLMTNSIMDTMLTNMRAELQTGNKVALNQMMAHIIAILRDGKITANTVEQIKNYLNQTTRNRPNMR